MEIHLSQEQKRMLITAFVTFLLAVATALGYDSQVVQPREDGKVNAGVNIHAPIGGEVAH